MCYQFGEDHLLSAHQHRRRQLWKGQRGLSGAALRGQPGGAVLQPAGERKRLGSVSSAFVLPHCDLWPSLPQECNGTTAQTPYCVSLSWPVQRGFSHFVPRFLQVSISRPQKRVKALVDCRAVSAEQLSFFKDEVIVVTATNDPHWWVSTTAIFFLSYIFSLQRLNFVFYLKKSYIKKLEHLRITLVFSVAS